MNNPLPSIPSHILDSVDENPSNSDETEQDSSSNSRKRGRGGGGKKRAYNRRSKPYCEINKQLRMEGKEYIGEKKTADGFIPVIRKARSMGPACKSIKCKQSTRTRFCHLFTEEVREVTFKHFWNESWETRKAYVRSLVEVMSSKKRNRPTLDARRRQIEFKYHLRKYGIRYQVCQTTFLNTLGIKHGSVKRWTQPLVAERFEEMEREKQQNPGKPADKRRRRAGKAARTAPTVRSVLYL